MEGLVCAGCGVEIPQQLLSCPGCRRLVHSEKLKERSVEAERLAGEGRLTPALSAWREVLELLPPGTRQHEAVVARIAALREKVDAPGYAEPPAASGAQAGKVLGAIGLAGLALWKFKFLLVAAASKAKFLLMGFSKSTTLFSMVVYLGPCWAMWGWKFALGIVLSIYIHEMGHVAALTRYGIKASAPMFVPGLGALVRLNQYPSDATEDARIGLAGPLWGMGAALASALLGIVTGNPLFSAVAKFGAWINLFNLVPVWQLDGGRGFRALTRTQRVSVAIAAGIAFAATGEGLLILIALVGALRAMAAGCPTTGGMRAYLEYAVLIVGLSALNAIPIALP